MQADAPRRHALELDEIQVLDRSGALHAREDPARVRAPDGRVRPRAELRESFGERHRATAGGEGPTSLGSGTCCSSRARNSSTSNVLPPTLVLGLFAR